MMGSGGELSVAKFRGDEEADADMKERDACRIGGAFRHRNLEAAAAIIYVL